MREANECVCLKILSLHEQLICLEKSSLQIHRFVEVVICANLYYK